MESSNKTKSMTVRTIAPFLVLTFGFTWGIAAIMIIFVDQVVAIFGEIGYTNPLYIMAVYGPAISAIILIWFYFGIKGLGSYFRRLTLWRMPSICWLLLLLGIPGIFYLGAAIVGTFNNPFPFEPWYTVFPALLIMLFFGTYRRVWMARSSPSLTATQIYPIVCCLDNRCDMGGMAFAGFLYRRNTSL